MAAAHGTWADALVSKLFGGQLRSWSDRVWPIAAPVQPLHEAQWLYFGGPLLDARNAKLLNEFGRDMLRTKQLAGARHVFDSAMTDALARAGREYPNCEVRPAMVTSVYVLSVLQGYDVEIDFSTADKTALLLDRQGVRDFVAELKGTYPADAQRLGAVSVGSEKDASSSNTEGVNGEGVRSFYICEYLRFARAERGPERPVSSVSEWVEETFRLVPPRCDVWIVCNVCGKASEPRNARAQTSPIAMSVVHFDLVFKGGSWVAHSKEK